MTPDQVVEAAVRAVHWAREYTDDVEFSAEDAVRSDVDFLCRVFAAVIEAGATTINVPDTVGYSIPSVWGELMRTLIARVPGADRVVWSTHCHNDLGMAVANSLSAVLAGARQVECTINGLGERAGNASLEEVVMAVRTRSDLFPVQTRIDTTQIVPASKLVSQITGYPVQPNKAVVGANAFAHESGHPSGRGAQTPRNLRDHACRGCRLGSEQAGARQALGTQCLQVTPVGAGYRSGQRRGAECRVCPLQGTGRQEARDL
jgi:2-isopropylmalate synthase